MEHSNVYTDALKYRDDTIPLFHSLIVDRIRVEISKTTMETHGLVELNLPVRKISQHLFHLRLLGVLEYSLLA